MTPPGTSSPTRTVPPLEDMPEAPWAPAIPAPIPMYPSGKRYWLVTDAAFAADVEGPVCQIVWPSGIRIAAEMLGVVPR